MNIREYLFRGDTRQILYKSLDAGTLRSKAIAQNLANISTPGFQRKEVSFEDQLKDVFDKKLKADVTQEGHTDTTLGKALDRVKPFAFEAQDQALPGEVNNVDIDQEMAKLAENQILFQYALNFSGFSKFNSAITGQATQ
jgi:flagellar basal-body rod protein FlgB